MKLTKIKLQAGGVSEVAGLMKTSRRTVFRALSGWENSPLAIRIRQCAMNHGGRYEDTEIPEGQWLSWFDHAGGVFLARFRSGATVTVSLRGDDMLTVWPDGRTETAPNPTMEQLYAYFCQLAATENTSDI